MPDQPQFLVGTASWTDPSLVNSDSFYPPSLKTAEERLRFYAAQFNTVEVDASYYTLLAERTVKLWVERTPESFLFNVKAFALLTQHAADVARLPRHIKELLTEREKAEPRLVRPSPAVLKLAFEMFWSSLAPLREAGKLAMVLFQFPPYFTFSTRNFDYIAKLPDLLPEAQLAIEFRHPSWVADNGHREETLRFLRERQFCYVSVDEPEAPSTIPSFLEATAPQAYVRFHGKNRENWFKKSLPPSERFKYLYSERELATWAPRLKGLRRVEKAFVIFNNCYRNFGIMNATTMAQMLRH